MQAFRQLRAAQAEMLKQLVMFFMGHVAAAQAKGAPKKGLVKSKAAPYGSEKLRAQGGKGWKDLAKKANIGGARDITRFHQAMDKLEASRARVVTDGTTPKKALTFSAEEVARIKAAPTPEAAKAEVLKIIGERTGKQLGDKGGRLSRSQREGAEREALNAILGTRVKAGHEKNATSASSSTASPRASPAPSAAISRQQRASLCSHRSSPFPGSSSAMTSPSARRRRRRPRRSRRRRLRRARSRSTSVTIRIRLEKRASSRRPSSSTSPVWASR